MKLLLYCFLLPAVLALSACERHRNAKDYEDYLRQLSQADRDYCSTNIHIAERGLIKCQLWLSSQKKTERPGFNYDLELYQVNGRLFLIYECLKDTNKAETCYQESVNYYNAYLRRRGLPDYNIPREKLREVMIKKEVGLRVGWKQKNEKRGSH